MTGNLNSVFSSWESGLKLNVFLHLFFLLDLCFPTLLEKRIEQLLPLSPNLPFQYRPVSHLLEKQVNQAYSRKKRLSPGRGVLKLA